jgi:hypothetical protein
MIALRAAVGGRASERATARQIITWWSTVCVREIEKKEEEAAERLPLFCFSCIPQQYRT